MPEDTFFQSSIVTDAIEDIMDMQNQVLLFAQYGEFASIQDQKDNLKVLRELQMKQKNMCFRCILSDSPDAKALLWEVIGHFEKYGHVVDPENPLALFDEVENNLQEIEDDLNFCEKYGYFPGEEPGGESPKGFDPII